MRESRFPVEQIVAVLRQVEMGMSVAEEIRQFNISEQTFYRWKKANGGLQPDQACELKQLQEENGRLKKLVAELSLDKVILQDIAAKSVWSSPCWQASLGLSDDDSLRRCVRPLASEALLHSGHDEFRAQRSYQVGRAQVPAFLPRLAPRQSTVSSSCVWSLANAVGCRSVKHRIDTAIGGARSDKNEPGALCSAMFPINQRKKPRN